MELLLAMVVVALIFDRGQKLPPSLCVHCDLLVRVEGDHYVHANGERYMPYPGIKTLIMHPAVPSATPLS